MTAFQALVLHTVSSEAPGKGGGVSDNGLIFSLFTVVIPPQKHVNRPREAALGFDRADRCGLGYAARSRGVWERCR